MAHTSKSPSYHTILTLWLLKYEHDTQTACLLVRISLTHCVLWPNETKWHILGVPPKIYICPLSVWCVLSSFFTSWIEPHGEPGTLPRMCPVSISYFKSQTLPIVWYEGDFEVCAVEFTSPSTSHLPLLSYSSSSWLQKRAPHQQAWILMRDSYSGLHDSHICRW